MLGPGERREVHTLRVECRWIYWSTTSGADGSGLDAWINAVGCGYLPGVQDSPPSTSLGA